MQLSAEWKTDAVHPSFMLFSVMALQGATIRRDDHTGAIVVARIMRGGAADRSGQFYAFLSQHLYVDLHIYITNGITPSV